MSVNRRTRSPKPDWVKTTDRLTKSNKVAIAKEYEERLRKGVRRESILANLSSKLQRDERTIQRYISEGRQIMAEEKQAQEFRRIQKGMLQERVKHHFDELAEAAKALYYIQQLLLTNPPSSIYSQLLPSSVSKFTFQTAVGVGFIPPLHFLGHFCQEFPNQDLKCWTDLLPQEVIDRLGYLGNTAKFRYCQTCQACIDLMA